MSLLTVLSAGCGSASPSSEPASTAKAASCVGLVQFAGSRYQLLFVHNGRPGAKLGEIVLPECEDVAGDTSGSGDQSEPIDVFEAPGIDPAVAVIVSPGEPMLAVVAGRCVGFTGRSFWDCLKRPLRFGGLAYTATPSVSGLTVGSALGRGVLARCCGLPAKRVRVLSIVGVPASRAVAVAGERRTIYLAPKKCMSIGSDSIRACLRGH